LSVIAACLFFFAAVRVAAQQLKVTGNVVSVRSMYRTRRFPVTDVLRVEVAPSKLRGDLIAPTLRLASGKTVELSFAAVSAGAPDGRRSALQTRSAALADLVAARGSRGQSDTDRPL
jgi:hypothetical protein